MDENETTAEAENRIPSPKPTEEVYANDTHSEGDSQVDKQPEKQETSFNVTASFSPEVGEIVRNNTELQSIATLVSDMVSTPQIVRKRKWGAGAQRTQVALTRVNSNTIRDFCPNLEIVSEDDIKLEEQQPEYKSYDRKVSVNSEESEGKRLEFQSFKEDEDNEEAASSAVDNSNIIAMNRKISIVEDTASKMRPPPSPASNAVSEVLFVNNLVRPFTLKQLKELLSRTGKIQDNGFWTDRIKSKCYVHYTSIE